MLAKQSTDPHRSSDRKWDCWGRDLGFKSWVEQWNYGRFFVFHKFLNSKHEVWNCARIGDKSKL